MEHFYIRPDDISGDGVAGDGIVLIGEEAHHASRVMRKSPGDEVYASAGMGTMYRIVIEDISRDEVRCRILERMERFNELPRDMVLIQGLLKNPGRMDFVIEKATELGVARVLPVQSRYTVAKGGKVDRWRAIALAAMKQCGRCRLPDIEAVTEIQSAITSIQGLLIVCDEQEDASTTIESLLKSESGNPGPFIIVIGPEGGFSNDERELFRESGASFVSLGSRRLRGETAAIAALARCAATLEQSHEMQR